MPRRQKDPASDVIDYFETAELSVAKTVHALADEVIRKRTAKTPAKLPTPQNPRPPRGSKPAAASEGPGTVSQVG